MEWINWSPWYMIGIYVWKTNLIFLTIFYYTLWLGRNNFRNIISLFVIYLKFFSFFSCFRCCYDWRWRTRWCKWRNKLWVYGNDYPGLIKPSKITFRDGENFCISHQIENSKNNFKSQCGYARKPFAKQYVIVSCWLFAYFLLFVKNFWVILKIQNLFFREYMWWSVQIF